MLDIAPWEVAQYFDAPQFSQQALTQTTASVLAADPTRAVVIFTQVGAGGVSNTVAVGSDPTNVFWSIALNRIFGIVVSTLPQVFTVWDHGPIVTGPWFAVGSSSMGLYLNIMAQTVHAWPGRGKSPTDLFATIDRGPKPKPAVIPAAPGVNGKKGVLDYWLKLISRFGGRS